MLNGLRRIYAVAKEKLIPKPPESDSDNGRERFEQLGAKVFSVPKSEIDQREKEWQRARKKSRK